MTKAKITPAMQAGRWITIAIAALLLVAPNMADWNTSHIYHPDWTHHSRLHVVWQLMMQSGFAAAALVLAMRRTVVPAALINCAIVGTFFVAYVLMQGGLYEGSLTDVTDGTNRIMGRDGNLLLFSLVLPVQVIALFMAAPSFLSRPEA